MNEIKLNLANRQIVLTSDELKNLGFKRYYSEWNVEYGWAKRWFYGDPPPPMVNNSVMTDEDWLYDNREIGECDNCFDPPEKHLWHEYNFDGQRWPTNFCSGMWITLDEEPRENPITANFHHTFKMLYQPAWLYHIKLWFKSLWRWK